MINITNPKDNSEFPDEEPSPDKIPLIESATPAK